MEDLEKFRGSAAAVEAKQNLIREIYRAAASLPKQDATVAGIYIGVTGDGRLRSAVLNVEPEHVPHLLTELRKVSGRLRRFAADRRERKEGIVLPLRPE